VVGRAVNHFEILGVPLDATQEEIVATQSGHSGSVPSETAPHQHCTNCQQPLHGDAAATFEITGRWARLMRLVERPMDVHARQFWSEPPFRRLAASAGSLSS
jgi:hypothetical protein